MPGNVTTLSCKRRDFREKLLNVKCQLHYRKQMLSETFLILIRIQRDIITNEHTSSCKLPIIIVEF